MIAHQHPLVALFSEDVGPAVDFPLFLPLGILEGPGKKVMSEGGVAVDLDGDGLQVKDEGLLGLVFIG